ncbi:hypothetical protein [Streptomyces sp. NBC_00199]|uniref:hypothetical protein n=1 Tax=Streptomyces sp. NBC_00199 TaxID=2975678 RepID=UPI00224E3F56|nr:hypothetical protein [Streptomyces sp. NBC_00199]MCX5263319.1 hypothetical protein [Streptomyces sp. NBC_00199]
MTPSAITQSSSPASAASAGATLSDLIVQSLTRHSSSEAFVAGDRRLTCAQVRDLVSQYMGALGRRGVGLGVGVTMVGSLVGRSSPWLGRSGFGRVLDGPLPRATPVPHRRPCGCGGPTA